MSKASLGDREHTHHPSVAEWPLNGDSKMADLQAHHFPVVLRVGKQPWGVISLDPARSQVVAGQCLNPSQNPIGLIKIQENS